MSADFRLIVGLGNPGADYVGTRHNAGFWLVDALARERDVSFRFDKRYNAEECRLRTGGTDIYLLKPMAFMNRSGQAVASLARYYKIEPAQILVMHDELDLPPGTNRIKRDGGHGGHNGLRDIISHLGSRDFFRIRIGIGHPGDSNLVTGYVLRKPSAADLAAIEAANHDTLAVMPLLFEGRVDKAMQALHT